MTRRILIDHTGYKGIGDLVCEMPFYQALRLQEPDAFLASRGSRTLAIGHPQVDAFDETSPDEAFDLVIRGRPPREFANDLRGALAAGRSIFDQFLLDAGLPMVGRSPDLYVLEREMAELGLEDDGSDGLIITYSVDSRELDRRWGDELFAELLAYLEQAHGASLVELGSGITSGHLGLGLNLTANTTLRQAMAVLMLSDLFVGNHGGLTHLAGGVGTPILSPWGSSHPYAAYAYDDLSIAVESDVPCRNCRWLGGGPEACWIPSDTNRTPCTQLISVDRMKEAADEAIARIQAQRDHLRARKAERRNRARDPVALGRFEQETRITDRSHTYLEAGGPYSGWAVIHGQRSYADLKLVVAFPDWLNAQGRWREFVRTFMASADPNSDWALVLSAFPLTGNDMKELIARVSAEDLPPGLAIPKVLILLGPLTLEQRRQLIRQAAVYVPCPSPYHETLGILDAVTPLLTSPAALHAFLTLPD